MGVEVSEARCAEAEPEVAAVGVPALLLLELGRLMETRFLVGWLFPLGSSWLLVLIVVVLVGMCFWVVRHLVLPAFDVDHLSEASFQPGHAHRRIHTFLNTSPTSSTGW
jgi:uncharacterized membrane protein